jgi:Co/Zn/Cd efflux system component
MLFGWSWLDPLMGLVGAGLVGAWAFGRLEGTSRVLLDSDMDDPVVDKIRDAVESPSTSEARIADLHVWHVGKSSFACALTVVTHDPMLTAGQVRQQLAAHRQIAHATIEVQRCG